MANPKSQPLPQSLASQQRAMATAELAMGFGSVVVIVERIIELT